MGEGAEQGEGARRAPLEVEVERLPPADAAQERADGTPAEKLAELERAVGPVVAGLLVDLLDAATVSPLLGLLLGWPLGAYVLRKAGLPPERTVLLGGLVGVYCALPGTFAIPVATVVGALVKVRQVMGGR